jgi:predicted transport protein
LFGANSKLEKTNIGDYGLTFNGKKVMSTGLGFASAQKINDQQIATTCPKSAICEALCLGETSGQNLLYGGQDEFRSGPRLSQYLKTEALIVNPEAFTVAMIRQIEAFRKAVIAIDPCVTEEFLKLYVAYKAETNFVDVIPQAKSLRLSLNTPFKAISDPRGICKDVSNTGRWGNGEVRVQFSSLSDLPYIMNLVRQAFDYQLSGGGDE